VETSFTTTGGGITLICLYTHASVRLEWLDWGQTRRVDCPLSSWHAMMNWWCVMWSLDATSSASLEAIGLSKKLVQYSIYVQHGPVLPELHTTVCVDLHYSLSSAPLSSTVDLHRYRYKLSVPITAITLFYLANKSWSWTCGLGLEGFSLGLKDYGLGNEILVFPNHC